jgi:hypothetical protein
VWAISLRTRQPIMLGAAMAAVPFSRPSRLLAIAAAGLVLTAGTGCPKKGTPSDQLAKSPDFATQTGQAKCGVKASAAKPLVVEWPAADRAALEARATRSLVAVRYQGCEMEVLTSCTVQGAYSYLGLNQKREGVRIKSVDELYAQLPVGAVGLEAKLERAGQLNVDMVIVGRKEAERFEFSERDLEGRCSEATHVITGLTLGAFSFYAGASAEVGAGVKVGNIGAGASSGTEREVLKEDGNADACAAATQADANAPDGCGALLRVEVVPIDRIFGGDTTTTTADGSGGGGGSSTSSNPTDVPTAPTTDPDLDKKLRNARIISASGYVGMAAGLGLLVVGVRMYSSNKSKLEAEMGTDTVSPDRQSNISKATTGLTLTFVGAGVSVLGLGLTTWGLIRTKNLKTRAGMAFSPLLGPTMAGIGASGRF